MENIPELSVGLREVWIWEYTVAWGQRCCVYGSNKASSCIWGEGGWKAHKSLHKMYSA